MKRILDQDLGKYLEQSWSILLHFSNLNYRHLAQYSTQNTKPTTKMTQILCILRFWYLCHKMTLNTKNVTDFGSIFWNFPPLNFLINLPVHKIFHDVSMYETFQDLDPLCVSVFKFQKPISRLILSVEHPINHQNDRVFVQITIPVVIFSQMC